MVVDCHQGLFVKTQQPDGKKSVASIVDSAVTVVWGTHLQIADDKVQQVSWFPFLGFLLQSRPGIMD